MKNTQVSLCLAFVRSGMFGLGIAPKEKLSRLFNPVSI